MDPALSKPAAAPSLLAGYRPFPGVPDEVVDAAGRVRPVWDAFLRHLAAIPAEDLQHRFGRGDQYLRDQGVYLRQYGAEGSTERAWPLSHIPVLIEEAEWETLTAGLIQRADLLERVMTDLYGPGKLVSDGYLPPSLIAGNSEWLRPLVDVVPRGGHFLQFVAFEIGRGPDGCWWVLGDRTQAPSGAGFALENRVATTRTFSDFYAAAHVHRLAGFFRAFRDTMIGLQADPESRVAILTPGLLTDTYFEHAYIARYLGFMLLQGEDLTVSDGQLMVRSVSGLRPVSVLWRRLDAAYADPLELDPASRLGTPGMVSALRQGSVTLVNALGSGVLETRALLAFLPRIARALLGEPLQIPNIATWWCGQAAERAQVTAHPERMVVSPAMSMRQPFEDAVPVDRRGAALAEWLAAEGEGLVAQEAVTLSTTPAHIDGALVPRPMSLRVFLLRTPDGWQAMPGGFARIGRTPDPAAVAMQRGGQAADVWIVSPKPVEATTMLPPASAPYRRPLPGMLPARAADNLFWLGRYVERTEGILRLLRSRNVRMAESGPVATPLIAAMDPLFKAMGVDPAQGIPAGMISTLGAAISTAGQVRDRFSQDGWSALADMDKTARRMAKSVTPGDDAARAVSALLRKLSGFSGLVHENMYRFLGWRFLELGRHHERAMSMAALLATLADPKAPEGALDLAVEVGDSVMTHGRRFAVATARDTVIDLLALDGLNPRAIRFQLDGIKDQVALLPGAMDAGQPSTLSRAVLRIHTQLASEQPETMTTAALLSIQGQIAGLSDLLADSYLH
ncbi:MAG: circularly permuted type 2 ATP-grasp protein [Rhodobacterales bacterium]|nr:circularly permuted type 2 ATP-grasp protein [Rhodobacterales bacterium]